MDTLPVKEYTPCEAESIVQDTLDESLEDVFVPP